MKKIFVLLFSTVLSISLIGCNTNDVPIEDTTPQVEDNLTEESDKSTEESDKSKEENTKSQLDVIEEHDDFYMYGNIEYGFRLKLPLTWEEHSVFDEEWVSNDETQSGVIINIRHPQWTEENPRQDIPIMVFNHEQWKLIETKELSISAAPIGPKYLGENDEYVFALPARYNFAFPTGYEEVDEIMESNPLDVF